MIVVSRSRKNGYTEKAKIGKLVGDSYNVLMIVGWTDKHGFKESERRKEKMYKPVLDNLVKGIKAKRMDNEYFIYSLE